MSYDTKIEELIGQQVAEYEAEAALAKKLRECLNTPVLPYGYPTSVYLPRHVCKALRRKPLVHHLEGKLSNDVPRVVSMELIGDYPLGLYNLRHSKDT